MRAVTIAAVAGVALLAAAFAGVGVPEPAEGGEPPSGRSITVTGTGTVKAVPDEAAFSFGVETRAPTAKQALAENASSMRRLIVALKEAGVDGDELQTESVSVWPRTEDGGSVVEYAATNTVRATVREIGKAGGIVDAASAAGANQISGPQLSRSNQEALYREALKAAVADAREKAEALADAAGVSVGRVVRVVEGAAAPEPVYERAALGGAADAATPIEPGKLETSASATVTFEIP